MQVSDARVGPHKAANSHNIPFLPSLSKATLCQTKLEGITPKRCSGVEKLPVLNVHASLNGCKLGDWAERVDSTTYRCKWCNKVGGQCHMVCYNSRKIDWDTLLEVISVLTLL